MIKFDAEALRKRLTEEGYSAVSADEMVTSAGNINEQLSDALNAWISDGSITDFAVEGVTFTTIMQKTKADFYHALFAMSVFIENPGKAKTFSETPFFFSGKLK